MVRAAIYNPAGTGGSRSTDEDLSIGNLGLIWKRINSEWRSEGIHANRRNHATDGRVDL